MQDIQKKEEENFSINRKKNTFFLNCSSVRKTVECFLLRHLKDNCSYLKKNHCFNYFKKVCLFTEIKLVIFEIKKT